ncbi:MAG: hypothetical protein ABI162_12565 [Luteolibacter sp.]
MTVADEGDVFALGIVEGDAKDFAGISGAFEDGADEDVLVAIDGLDLAGFLHAMLGIFKHPPKQSGELEPYRLARLLRTAWKWDRS